MDSEVLVTPYLSSTDPIHTHSQPRWTLYPIPAHPSLSLYPCPISSSSEDSSHLTYLYSARKLNTQYLAMHTTRKLRGRHHHPRTSSDTSYHASCNLSRCIQQPEPQAKELPRFPFLEPSDKTSDFDPHHSCCT